MGKMTRAGLEREERDDGRLSNYEEDEGGWVEGLAGGEGPEG